MSPTLSRDTFRPLAVLGVLLLSAFLLAPLAGAQEADATFRDFEPIGEFTLSVDGKALENAEIFQSNRARAILVLSPDLPEPLLFNLRNRRVETVGFMSLAKRPDGTMDVLADGDLVAKGTFRMDANGAVYDMGGKTVKLAPKASLTGPQTSGSLKEYDPGYARRAADYSPNDQLVSKLRQRSEPVQVRVFFNSKCSVCKQMVPRMIRVQEALAGSKVKFDFYGLPDNFSDDPVAERLDVHGVPTGIVYVGGKEVGRIMGNRWRTPELALTNVLSEANG